MADTAFMTRYRNEFIAAFEQHQSILRETVTTEGMIDGQIMTFLVAGSNNAQAVTRGVNGLIPARNDDLQQFQCTLTEQHDLVRRTGFNIFASQGNAQAIMQLTTTSVLNRKIDSQIVTELNNGTVTVGSAGTMPSVSLTQNGKVKLQNASVPWDRNITMLCQPGYLAILEQAPEFTNVQYVDDKLYAGGGRDPAWRDKPTRYMWRDMMFMSHPNLPGKGTTSGKSFMYHKSAIGHAINMDGLRSPVGYDEEQDYSWARASAYMAGKALQNSGIIVFTTDDSIYA